MARRFPDCLEFVPPAPRNQKKPTRAAKQRTQSVFLPHQSKEKNNSGVIRSAAGQAERLLPGRLLRRGERPPSARNSGADEGDPPNGRKIFHFQFLLNL
jgi:hypothetical protein